MSIISGRSVLTFTTVQICYALRSAVTNYLLTAAEEGVTMGGALSSGLISAVISIVATFVMTLIIPSDDRTWALIAVTVAGFFSGFFSYNAAGGKRNA